MEINYNNYPTLLFLSYNQDNAPDELPFEVLSEAVKDYLTTAKGYQELFSYIAVKNTIEKSNTNTNFYLNIELFHKVDNSETFRTEFFGKFFSEYVKPKNGTILFKAGGQYVYLLLGKNDTKKLKGKDGRYMAVAFFKENIFIGFEECIITDRGLQVMDTGYYEGGMDIGGYLSFCIITLAYANNKNLPICKFPVNEIIFEL